ncbi:MAG: peptide chain release factor 2 [Clostridiales bacterium]|nr:peptide chain release factor 2 [Clostridiales bacterium]
MYQLDQAILRLHEIDRLIAEAGDGLNLPAMKNELEELHAEMAAPDFWSSLERAQRVNKRVKLLERRIDHFEKVAARSNNTREMIDLLEEVDDADLLAELEQEMEALYVEAEEMALATLLTGPYDANNAILSLHAGAGGTEAQDWTQMLYRMYIRWCERRGYTLRALDYLEGDEAGIKSVTFMVEGENAYGYLKAEKGVHRLVRISPFDASARRHTSFASLDVMPEIEDDEEIKIEPDDLRIDTYRSSGAGGQHVNKTDSAVRITHLPTGIVVSCQNERSQIQNRETAMKMLKAKLAELREEERMARMAGIKGEIKKIEWGSQIRSYVFQPYTMVKDHRTNAETGNVDAVMDGEIDDFITEYLKKAPREGGDGLD